MYQPHYTITETLLARISEAETLRTKIQTAPVQLAWLENIRLDALVRRAHFSTAIEGNPLTLPEVEALAGAKKVDVNPAPRPDGRGLGEEPFGTMPHSSPPLRAGPPWGGVKDRAKREVLNYLAALRWIARQPANTPATERAVLKLHRMITAGLLEPRLVGAYKVSANVIMSAGQVVYRPPGPQAAKPGTRALIAWLEGPGQSTHPIVASACAHYEIARLHPFRDGNGRVARALATWILYHRGFDTQHLFAVDQYFKEDHEGYYHALQRVRKEDEDLTSWLEYAALAVLDTLHRTYNRLEHLALPPSAKGLFLTRQHERLLLELQGKRGMTVEELQRLLRVERVQVYRVLRPLVKKRIVGKSTTRPVVYRLAPRQRQ